MKQAFLFPQQFKAIGWILLIVALAAGGAFFFGLVNTTGMTETIANDAAVIGIALGALFIIASKEKIEDEMTGTIRLRSLLNALYVYVAILIIGTIFINGIDFLAFLFFDSILFPCIFVLVFQMQMRRHYLENGDEE